MNKKMILRHRSLLVLTGILLFAACRGKDTTLPANDAITPSEAPGSITPYPSETPDEVTSLPSATPVPELPKPSAEAPTKLPDLPKVLTTEDIQNRFFEAMTGLEPEVVLNIDGMTWTWGIEIDLKNIYYTVLAEYPELKYTYDAVVSVEDTTAVCQFSYMPYITGAYASGVPSGSHTVGSLYDAKIMAQSMINGTKQLPIAITDTTLSVNDIGLALLQAGYGWVAYTLNADGTEIIASPAMGKTLSECADAINESFALCSRLLSELTDDTMTTQEKVSVVYSWLVKNVSYDFRYYTDRYSMPYESTVALGALQNGTAICGGYAHTFEMLLTMLGVENYTVSGMCNKEHHMWNYLVLDGTGYYCDATADRGGMDRHFMLTEAELEAYGGYSWNKDFYKAIQKQPSLPTP